MNVFRKNARSAILRLTTLGLVLLPIVAAGCDDDDFDSREIIDIIYAIGDVVLGIILAFS